MPNGERIQFGRNVNFIFETHDLRFASPATISRMGMIFLSDPIYDEQAVVNKWSAACTSPLQPEIASLSSQCLNLLARKATSLSSGSSVNSALDNWSSWLTHSSDATEFRLKSLQLTALSLPKNLSSKFISENGRSAGLDDENVKRILVSFWSEQSKRVEIFQDQFDEDDSNFVKTASVQSLMHLISDGIRQEVPLLLMGSEGAGKIQIVSAAAKQLRSTSALVVHCNTQTTSEQVLHCLSAGCVTVTSPKGLVLRPKLFDRLVVVIKNIQLPLPDKYGSVSLLSWLLSALTFGGFYTNELAFVRLEKITFVATISSPKDDIPLSALIHPRLAEQLVLIQVPETTEEHLRLISQTLLKRRFSLSIDENSAEKMAPMIAQSIVSLFSAIRKRFHPGLQSHYRFSMRHITRWIDNIALYNLDNNVPMALSNEAKRIFCDVLTKDKERAELDGLISQTFRIDSQKLEGCCFIPECKALGFQQNRLDLCQVDIRSLDPHVVKDVTNFSHERSHQPIVLSTESMQSLVRCLRLISMPDGHAILVGKSGCGRHLSIELASFMLDIKVFRPAISRNYKAKNFIADLKQLLSWTGIDNHPYVLLLDDNAFVDGTMWEFLDALLSSWQVPGMYARDEFEALLSSIKEEFETSGHTTVSDLFFSRVRRNLHVVVIVESATFPKLCDAHPVFLSKCQVVWQDHWNRDTLNEISLHFLRTSAFSNDKNQMNSLEKALDTLVQAHEWCELQLGSSPRQFLVLLQTFFSIFSRLHTKYSDRFHRLADGLQKLQDASEFVAKLKLEANEQSLVLFEKQKQADAALKEISDSMMRSAQQKQELEALNITLQKEEQVMNVQKSAVQEELKSVEPLVQSARESVGQIRSEHLSEMRSLRAPPAVVRDVLEGVLRLMGIYDVSWNSMKSFLGKRTIKEEIMNFDARNIAKNVRESVQQLISQKPDSFDEATVKRSSVAAAPLALWVKANIQYAMVIDKIEPLESELKRLEESLDKSQKRVSALKSELDLVDENVARLRANFAEKTREVEHLKEHLAKATKVIEGAETLLSGLTGEQTRWNRSKDILDGVMITLAENCRFASAYLVYLGRFTEAKRSSISATWKSSLQMTFSGDFCTFLASEADVLTWKSQGLAGDMGSIENAIIILNAYQPPLIIDPSNQCFEWLQNHFRERKIDIISLKDANFGKSLELAIRFGKTLLVTNVDQIDPSLAALLRRDYVKQGTRTTVALGDKVVDVDENFKIFLLSRDKNFSLSAQYDGLVAEINFSMTEQGFAGQLLGLILENDRPELEENRRKLIKKEEELKSELFSLEDMLLQQLSDARGNILENQPLLESLSALKSKSSAIEESLMESALAQQKLEQERNKYVPLSVFASKLYASIEELSEFNLMYCFGSEFFVRMFKQVLRNPAGQANDPLARCSILTKLLEQTAFYQIKPSLFKADHNLFAIHLIRRLHPYHCSEVQWKVFVGEETIQTNPGIPSWIDPQPGIRRLLVRNPI
jgi:dynein heavy chain 2